MKFKNILHERFYLLLYNIMVVFCAAQQPIMDKKYASMTACEYSVHTKCVMKLGIEDKFVKHCDETDIVKCLNDHLLLDICRKNDSTTLSTIEALIEQLNRRFKRNKKCADEKFIRLIQDHFLVLGEVIEYSEATKSKIKEDEPYSGSGNIPDDTEDDDDDDADDDIDNKYKNNIRKISTNSVNNNTKNTDKTDEIKYWQENAKKNLILREKQKKTILVFFDDPKQYLINKIKEQKKIPKPVYSAWEKLKREYQKWFQNSKYKS